MRALTAVRLHHAQRDPVLLGEMVGDSEANPVVLLVRFELRRQRGVAHQYTGKSK